MDTLPLAPVELLAVDPARNIRRRWSIAATHDLFGMVMVETAWGRIGARGRSLIRSFADEAAALCYIRALLARRGTARQRLGIEYVTTH